MGRKVHRIRDQDSLYRHVRAPVAFKKKSFNAARFWHLVSKPNGLIETSVMWGRYVPTEKYVHESGCRVAATHNERLGAADTSPKTSPHVYCGAYHLNTRSVSELVGTPNLGEIIRADVLHAIENGELAHAAVRIWIDPDTQDVESTKTAIVDRLWTNSSGPLRFVCEQDKHLSQHPSTNLVDGPVGPHVDRRCFVVRLWYLLRFFICRWIWKRGFGAI